MLRSLFRLDRRFGLPILLMAFVIGATLIGHAQNTPPSFTGPYFYPDQTWPQPRAEVLTYLDITLLVVGLLLAAYLVLVKRSRWGTFFLMIGALAYFGFYRHGCICPIGSIQNVALAIVDRGYPLPLVAAAFFLIPLVAALFFGRVFCAAICPLGAMQDLVVIKPIKLPIWLEHALGVIPYIYLGGAVMYAALGSAFLICRYDPFVAFFRLNGQPSMLALGGIFLAVGTVIGRPYCRFFCPYSALLRLLAPLSKWKPKITPTTCTQCRLCSEGCPFNSIDIPTPAPSAGKRLEGRRTLILLIALMPVFLAVGALLGYASSRTLAQVDPTVLIAQAVWRQEQNDAATAAKHPIPYKLSWDDQERITANDRLGGTTSDLYQQEAGVLLKYRTGATWFGVWIGLVIGMTLIMLTVRRSRTDYETDPALCVACARCFSLCPYEQERIEKVQADNVNIPE